MSAPTSRWSTASRAGGVTSPGVPAGEGTFDYWTLHAEQSRASRCAAAPGSQGTSPATPACSISRPSAAHHRGASALRRPVAGSLWRRLGRGAGAALSQALGFRRRRPPRRLQRRAVRAARPALSPSAAARSSTTCCGCRAYRACRSPFTRTALPNAHAMPPGGFRLAIVNCFDLDAGAPRASGSRRISSNERHACIPGGPACLWPEPHPVSGMKSRGYAAG